MPATPSPSCPRCNYDLSGTANAWTDSCPLTGICSECGLPFRWRDVFHPDRLVVRGFVEHARGPLRTLASAWITWTWTLWPAVFWRKVRIEHRPRMLRCILWLAILILPLHALVATARSVAVWRDYLDWDNSNRTATLGRGGPPLAFHSTIKNFPWANALAPWSEPLIYPDHGPWWFMGQYVRGWELLATPSPGKVSASPRLNSWPPFVPAIAAISFTVPVVLLVLPVTRRRAKVRAPLVWRSAIYGCAWMVIPALAWVVSMAAESALRLSSPTGWTTGQGPYWQAWPAPTWTEAASYSYQTLHQCPLTWLSICLVWTVLWWRSAIRAMFQGHSPRSVMAAAFIAGALSALIPLLGERQFLEWLVTLPGADLFFPPKPPPLC